MIQLLLPLPEIPATVGGNATAQQSTIPQTMIVQGLIEMGHKRRADGRLHDTGMVRPYRPCPPDFRETFLAMGWDGIDEHYRTNFRVIRRWVEECGGEDLRAERRKVSGGTARPSLRSVTSRYVMGLRLGRKG